MKHKNLNERDSRGKTNENGLKTLSFNDKDKIKGKVNSTMIDFLMYVVHPDWQRPRNRGVLINCEGFTQVHRFKLSFINPGTIHFTLYFVLIIKIQSFETLFISFPLFLRKTNKKGLKTLSFNDKDKINGKVNSTKIDFLV
ncbi:unnamed protein product [Malus baccata var. baccata]